MIVLPRIASHNVANRGRLHGSLVQGRDRRNLTPQQQPRDNFHLEPNRGTSVPASVERERQSLLNNSLSTSEVFNSSWPRPPASQPPRPSPPSSRPTLPSRARAAVSPPSRQRSPSGPPQVQQQSGLQMQGVASHISRSPRPDSRGARSNQPMSRRSMPPGPIGSHIQDSAAFCSVGLGGIHPEAPSGEPPRRPSHRSSSAIRRKPPSRQQESTVQPRGSLIAEPMVCGGSQSRGSFNSSDGTGTSIIHTLRSVENPPEIPTPESVLTDTDIAETLKHILIDRHGSLDDAFRWFDFNSFGRISRSQLDTGMRIINPEGCLKHIKVGKLFAMLDISHKGNVCLEDWRNFFGYAGDDKSSSIYGSRPKDASADKFDGVRGGRLLSRVKHVINAATKRAKIVDDTEERGSVTLPKLDTILESLDGEPELLTPSKKRKAEVNLMSTDTQKAEALQLEEDIKQLDLNGVRALAYIFAAKCGSLDAAFQWMDCTAKGSFARVQWETAVTVLHIDIKELTGIQPRDVFLMMGGHNGRVSKNLWDKFFANELDESDWKNLDGVQQSFKQRTRKKLQQMWKSAPQNENSLSNASVHRDSQAARGHLQSSQRAPSNNASARPWSSSKKHIRKDDNSVPAESRTDHDVLKDETTSGADQDESDTAKGSQRILHNASNDTKLQAHALSDTRSQSKQAGSEVSKAPNSDLSGEAVQHSGSDDFRSRVHHELFALGVDEGCEYSSLKRAERVSLEEVTRDMGLWCAYRGQALLLYREGPEADLIRKKLQALKPGEGICLTELPLIRAHFACDVAEGLGLWVSNMDAVAGVEDSSNSVEVFNLGGSLEDFKEGMSRLLHGLAPGEVFNFPSALNVAQQELVTAEAEALGLRFHMFEGKDGCLSVGNLAEFEGKVREQIAALAPGTSKTFGPCSLRDDLSSGVLPPLARRVVQLAAEEAGLSYSDSTDGTHAVTVERPEVASHDQAALVDPVIEFDENTTRENVARLFGYYSSGRHGKTRLFLRKLDLTKFVTDACGLRQKSQIDDVMEYLERVYDDTLELQVDLGSRYSHGITLEYFQVFLSKTAQILGWTLAGLLMALLKWFGE